MLITRSSTEGSTATAKGPAEWFTGDVYIDPVAASPAPSRVQANLVHFMPGARTAWHSHPLGQTLFVTEGVGLCQRRGGPIEVIRAGDRVYIEPDEEHWHGATLTRLMVHLALNEVTTSTSLPTGASTSVTTSTTVPAQTREASNCSRMALRDRPLPLGPSCIFACTLVATTMSSRREYCRMARHTNGAAALVHVGFRRSGQLRIRPDGLRRR